VTTSAPLIALRDAIDSNLAGLGSDKDISASLKYRPSCADDLAIAYLNGGLFSEVVEFWPNRIGSGLLIEVKPAKENASARDRAELMQGWLESKFSELAILSMLTKTEASNAIGPGAGLLVVPEERRGMSRALANSRSVAEIVPLPHTQIRPNLGEGANQFAAKLQTDWHPRSNGYLIKVGTQGEETPTIGDRLITMPAKIPPMNATFDHRQKHQSQLDEFQALWGIAWIGPQVLDAAKQLDAAVAISLSILAKKNALYVSIKDLFDKLTGESKEANQKYLEGVLHMLNEVLNRRGVYLGDMDKMSVKTLEFSLAGIEDIIKVLRRNLLMHCPDIPEIHLFGAKENGGINQGTSKYDEERVDSIAEQKFEGRWAKPLRQIVRALTLSRECPIPGYPESLIRVSRISTYMPSPLEAARTRLVDAQAKKLEMELKTLAEASSTPLNA
jgi:hypothetical protein